LLDSAGVTRNYSFRSITVGQNPQTVAFRA
jgi:hypothetical protein